MELKNNKRKQSILLGTTVLLAIILSLIIFLSSSSATDPVIIKDKSRLKIEQVSIPDSLSFCGEAVPLQYFDVRESLDRELLINTYWQSQTILFLKKAHRYFPIIDSILKAESVPIDFRYLPVIESGLSNATSPSGAKGFWQFLAATGKEYGLEISNQVDERYNLELSTQAACIYLRKSYKKFGNWTLAAASYNMGMSGLQNQINSQETNNYYDLDLNSETGRYVYRILALKLIMENPEKYFLHISNESLYKKIPTNVIEIDSSILDITKFAKENGTNYKIIQLLNPWLLNNTLVNNTGKKYRIVLPTENGRTVSMKADSLTNERQ